MGIRYTHFYDEFRGLLDSLMHDSDETQRLSNINQLNKDATSLILKARDEAAYELRTRFAGADAEAISGVARPTLDYWASPAKAYGAGRSNKCYRPKRRRCFPSVIVP